MRQHAPPMWLLYRLRQRLPALATYIETAMDAYARTDMRPVALDVNGQANVMLAAGARWMQSHADAMRDGIYDDAELSTQLPIASSLHEHTRKFIELAQGRLGVTTLRKAGA
jgi:hypothetical protein